jgi:rhodanese-related sulfurtransferase
MKTLFFASMLIFVAACSSLSNNAFGQVINKKVEKAEFSKLMKKSGVQLIDVRTSREFSNGFITGAKNIDYNGDSFEKQIKKLDKNKPVLVYCAAGGRSENAAELLKEWGFKEVYDLIGGYNGWKE